MCLLTAHVAAAGAAAAALGLTTVTAATAGSSGTGAHEARSGQGPRAAPKGRNVVRLCAEAYSVSKKMECSNGDNGNFFELEMCSVSPETAKAISTAVNAGSRNRIMVRGAAGPKRINRLFIDNLLYSFLFI